MKKIGVLTFHKPINYGAFLQSYSFSNALSRELKNVDVEIIDYVAPLEKRKVVINLLWTLKHFGLKEAAREYKKIKMFRSYQKVLNVSEKSSFDTLRDLYEYIDNEYDALIIGSDAVFNWNQNGYPTAFIPDYEFSIPVLTYAASVHGLRFYDETKETIKQCKSTFDKMSFVGVRDKCTETFVQYCCGESRATHCCDPTFMFTSLDTEQYVSDYEDKMNKRYGFDINEKYIVFMGTENKLMESIKKRYGNDYTFVSAFKNNKYTDIFLYDINPFEWAKLLSKATIVVTSYFHGTLLSLINNTPVIVLDYSGYNDNDYEGKLKDVICSRLNLDDFLFDQLYAENFTNDEGFWTIFDNAIAGAYDEKIKKNVLKEKESFYRFLDANWNLLSD